MPRISSGGWGWSSGSEGGVGDGGLAAEFGMVMSSRGPSSVGSGSGRVVVVVVGSVLMWVSAGAGPSCFAFVVFGIGGSSLWSVGVGMLVCLAASRSCSYASASNQNII